MKPPGAASSIRVDRRNTSGAISSTLVSMAGLLVLEPAPCRRVLLTIADIALPHIGHNPYSYPYPCPGATGGSQIR